MLADVPPDGIERAKDTQTIGATTAEEEEMIVMATVTLKAHWIGRLRNEKSAKEFLTELAENQRCHKVEAIPDGERWRLEGCICGIKAAREELIRRSRHLHEAAAAASLQPSTSTASQRVRELRPAAAATHSMTNENFTARERNGEEDAKTKEEEEKAMKTESSIYPSLNDVHTTQQQENKRSTYDDCGGKIHSNAPRASVPSNADDGQRNSAEVNDRMVALKFARNVKVDGPVFKFLCTKEIEEITRISRRCSLFESYEDGSSHRVAIEAKPGEDLEAIVANFEDLCHQVTEEVMGLPDEAFVGDFENNIRANLDTKKVDLYFVKDANICQMIGRKKDIAEVRRKLEELIRSNEAERFESRRAPHVNHGYHPHPPHSYPHPPYGSSYSGSNAPYHHPPHPPNGSSYSGSNAPYPHPPHPPNGSSAPYRPPPFTIRQEYQHYLEVIINSKDPLMLELSGRDMFEVCNNYYSDAAVTLIDHYLNPCGFLAKEIASKYPWILIELQQLKIRQQFLSMPTGSLVHTNGCGFPGVKVLLHLVAPIAGEYPPKDLQPLRSAFVNCFKYTNDVLKMNSLCLPAVGCNIYPVSMVVDCFMDAVEEFLRSINNTGSASPHLRCIRFVNNDRGQMSQLIAGVKGRLQRLR